MKRKSKIIIEKGDLRDQIMRIGKKAYIEKEILVGRDRHVKRVVLEEIDEKEWEKDIDFVVTNIIKVANKKQILRQALKSMTLKEIGKIKKEILKGEKPKITEGCYCIRIGKTEIPIIE